MSSNNDDLVKWLLELPDELVQQLAISMTDDRNPINELRGISDQYVSEGKLTGEHDYIVLCCTVLERLVNIEKNTSRSDLHAAVCFALSICRHHCSKVYGDSEKALRKANQSKWFDQAEETLMSTLRMYQSSVGGARAGQRKRAGVEADTTVAAQAFNELWGSSNMISPKLADIAEKLERDGASMSYPAKGGWLGRLEITIGRKAVVDRAEELRKSGSSRK